MSTRFYTGKGDDGESRVGEMKVSKSDPLLGFLGVLDTLNSWFGLARVEADKNIYPTGNNNTINIAGIIRRLQEILFVAQAEVAATVFQGTHGKRVTSEHTKEMEELIKTIDAVVPSINSFIVPGGSELSARLDVARAMAREVERDAKKLSEAREFSGDLLQFLNRLSSILFALARYANYVMGVSEEGPRYR